MFSGLAARNMVGDTCISASTHGGISRFGLILFCPLCHENEAKDHCELCLQREEIRHRNSNINFVPLDFS